MQLAVRSLTFAYPDAKTPLFRDAGLDVAEGELLVLRGPSGAGKSTFLRLLCRLEEPDSGDILLRGKSLRDLPPPRLRREISYIQQTPTLIPGTVRDNLLLPFSFKANAGLMPPDDRQLTAWLDEFLLQGVDLTAEATRVSVGQAQRLCLIRSMLLSPAVLLLDEPTSALDPASARAVIRTVEHLSRERRLTMLMVTHTEHLPEGASFLELRGGKVLRPNTGQAGDAEEAYDAGGIAGPTRLAGTPA